MSNVDNESNQEGLYMHRLTTYTMTEKEGERHKHSDEEELETYRV